MVAGMWRIVQSSNIKFDDRIGSVDELPYTLSYLVKKRMQIDNWMELPREKRPPESIWDKPGDLEEWFDRIYGEESQTEFSVGWNENEVET